MYNEHTMANKIVLFFTLLKLLFVVVESVVCVAALRNTVSTRQENHDRSNNHAARDYYCEVRRCPSAL
jgi:CHASE3 domain sensor protein